MKNMTYSIRMTPDLNRFLRELGSGSLAKGVELLTRMPGVKELIQTSRQKRINELKEELKTLQSD